MLGLPSTTEVNAVLPKQEFYQHLNAGEKLKRAFVQGIERITVRNSLKTATLGVPDGTRVHEALVLEVALKSCEVPEEALAAIAQKNPHKLVFVCTFEGCECAAVALGQRLALGAWQPAGALHAVPAGTADMDAVWDSLASQLVYRDDGMLPARTVEERYERDAQLAALRERHEKLDARMRREKQPARKRELFGQLRELETQIEQLEQQRAEDGQGVLP